jgi:phage terminase Nu1 subunit (DNA packaging protein)
MALERMVYNVEASLDTEMSAEDVSAMLVKGVPREAGIRYPEACATEVDDIVVGEDTISMVVKSPLRTEDIRNLLQEAMSKEVSMKHPQASCNIVVTAISGEPEE